MPKVRHDAMRGTMYSQPRTMQGGNGRSMTQGGVPNVLGRGIMQKFMGGNPPRRTPYSGGKPPMFQMGPFRTDVGGGPRGGPNFGAGMGGGMGQFGGGLFPGGRGPHGGMGGGGRGPGGGGYGPGGNPPPRPGHGGGQGGGAPGPPPVPPSPFDPNNLDQIINGTGDYGKLMQNLGLPMDPQFLAQRTNLVNNRDSGLSQLLNQFNVGNAQLDQQSMLGQRQISENDAARGLYGSGIQARDNRLLGNDVAQNRFGLQNAYSQGQLGTQQDYRSQMMQAMQDLAGRAQGQQNLPLPNWGPWAQQTGGGGSHGGNKGGKGGKGKGGKK